MDFDIIRFKYQFLRDEYGYENEVYKTFKKHDFKNLSFLEFYSQNNCYKCFKLNFQEYLF